MIADELHPLLHAVDKHAADDLQDVLRKLRIELVQLGGTLAELMQIAAAERRKLVELPALLL